MNTWTPIFNKIVDSSLWREDDITVKVFLTMLAKKDADQVVRASAFMIGEWAKKTEAETIKALKVLSSPDTKRIEKQPFDGRRVEKVDGGWLILNGEYYEKLMRDANRRVYKTAKEREYRAKAEAAGHAKVARASEKRNQQEIEERDYAEYVATKNEQTPPPSNTIV